MDNFATQSAEATAAEFELLRAEIEQLQYELAERDALLTEVTATSTTFDKGEDTETGNLVGRLEQLLDELERSDGRINALEQLLQASEESSRAEQEERRQLEVWMTDIESRIAEREADWNAETESLRRRVQEVSQERDQLIGNRTRREAISESPDADQQLLTRLDVENAQLRQSLDQAKEEQSRLTEQLRQQQNQREQATDTDSEMREERLALAQERASLTRQRAELAAMRSELESQPVRPASEIDGRVRVFREHLREIQEKEEKQRSQQSLTSRMSRIWKRLETRA